jgi:hypothetical protein
MVTASEVYEAYWAYLSSNRRGGDGIGGLLSLLGLFKFKFREGSDGIGDYLSS